MVRGGSGRDWSVVQDRLRRDLRGYIPATAVVLGLFAVMIAATILFGDVDSTPGTWAVVVVSGAASVAIFRADGRRRRQRSRPPGSTPTE